MDRNIDFSDFMYGGDYNPEQWLNQPEVLEQDIEYLKKANCNVVTLGVFSWSTLEPEEGIFNFEWLEKIIDNLYKNGIYVILATPSAARPKWLTDKYPEVLRVDYDRTKRIFGGRHNFCPSSKIYRQKTEIINNELAKRFANHPAVLLWHISNELSGDCYCPSCQENFRKWLKEKYKTIDKVNEAWNTTFWSHTYQNFEQIEAPSKIGESLVHGLNLDWRRFVTDITLDFVKHEIKTVRKYNDKLPATINMMHYFGGLNYVKMAKELDLVSWDSYPEWHSGSDYEVAIDTGMFHDIVRCMKKQPFLLMESCPTSTNWQKVSKLKKPGVLELASMQAVAHGSNSVLYFQIRQSLGASEKFHGAVISHYSGTDTRVFGEITDLGKNLKNIKEILNTQTKSEVAVFYDWENKWALENSQGPRNCGLHYMENVQKIYKSFTKLGLNVDVIDMNENIEDYKIVAAPMIYMFRDGFEEKVEKFVKNGGIFIMTYWSGIADESDICYRFGTPHGLIDVMGLRSEEIDGLYDFEENEMCPLNSEEIKFEKTYKSKYLCDLVKLTTAKPLMAYGKDFYKGMAALTENVYGKGKAYYVCTDAEQEFYDNFIEKLAQLNNIKSLIGKKPSKNVIIKSRESENYEYIFVQNFENEFAEFELPKDMELIYGEFKENEIKPYSTIILKRKK